jgi:hypothetical protein
VLLAEAGECQADELPRESAAVPTSAYLFAQVRHDLRPELIPAPEVLLAMLETAPDLLLFPDHVALAQSPSTRRDIGRFAQVRRGGLGPQGFLEQSQSITIPDIFVPNLSHS